MIEEIALGEETVRRGGLARATRLEGQARLSRFRGRAARTGGFYSAGRTLLTGFGEAFG